jgi:lipopolysaccharide/colanic/teichoic acid biosynthesis glycosyltransferase
MEAILVNQPRVFPRKKIQQITKRWMDLVMCILGLPILMPVMLICGLAIRLDDPDGPIIFVQERIGKGGRPFWIYKFRTMRVNSDDKRSRNFMKAYVRGEIGEDNGQKVYKPIQAQQVFRVGRFLRKTSLDELPQIFNILKGEMSVVGPRPNVPWEVDAYRPWHHERMEVLPGITGLAQVKGRSSISFNSLVRHDIEYVENQSLVLDLKILWWTAKAIMRGKGVM